MFQIRKTALACAFALAVPVLALAEDLTIVSKVTSPKGGSATSTQYLSTDKVRTSDGDTDTIMDLATGRLLMINNKKKEYSETSLDEMRAFVKQFDAAMAGNPIMEKMMGKMGEVTVTKGSGGRQIAGYDTEQYTLAMGESMRFEIFAAPGLQAPSQYFDARKAMYAALGPMGRKFEAMFDEMKKIKGFPLATNVSMKMMMMKQETMTEATEVRKGPIAPSVFDAPAGFKKTDSPFKEKKR